MRRLRSGALLLTMACGARAGDWSAPVEVRHDEEVAVAYRARVDGPWLVVRATLGPGWHTFAMDNKRRSDEKLAGKKALSVDKPTEITAVAGLEFAGGWHQSPPKDFSHPELRWFSWGFEREAVFAVKLRRPPDTMGRLEIRGQACTDTVCKNIDVSLAVPAGGGAATEINVKDLVPVR
ncbi:MAG TPA: hypothetical protein VMS37_36340 [Verrucomicrobiae bacterium]|nr:hypothetical protein [Verrucomicrobiae bacterium]